MFASASKPQASALCVGVQQHHASQACACMQVLCVLAKPICVCAISIKPCSFLQGPLAARWLDEADCVGAWLGTHLAAAVFPAAVFPTADCLGLKQK